MGEITERFRNRIIEKRDEYLEVLKEMLSFPSVSATGEGMDEAPERVARALERAGLRVEIFREFNGYPAVWGELREERHGTLLIYNHYDVQPPDPIEKWTSDPFKPSIRDGRIYARGACDNKGNLAARLCAIDLLMDSVGEVPLNIKFLVEGEEEIGSPNLEKFFKNHRDSLSADACLWEMGGSSPEGRPLIYLGAKGILYLEIHATEKRPDLHSSWGAIVRNPALELVHVISTLRNREGLVTVDGFYDDVEKPDSETLALLDELGSAESEIRAVAGEDGLISRKPLKELFTDLTMMPCINVCGLNSGYTGPGSKTVLPNTAYAKIDVRLVPRMRPEKILELIIKHVERVSGGRVSVRPLEKGYPAARTSPSEPFVELVKMTAEAAHGVKPLVYPSSPGSGPMYLVTDFLGTPCVAAGIGDHRSNIHAPDESISLEDYLKGILHIALTIINFVPYLRSGVAPYL
ncbi:MAG: M20/M25/M40 family metallo-hydrolase [Nitrososphaerota archaeon]|nr:M20/M25/M40 family metallo-hydrolase [Nitrososphaerota archaeon]